MMAVRCFAQTPKDRLRLFIDIENGLVAAGDAFARQYLGRPLNDLVNALQRRDGGKVVFDTSLASPEPPRPVPGVPSPTLASDPPPQVPMEANEQLSLF